MLTNIQLVIQSENSKGKNSLANAIVQAVRDICGVPATEGIHLNLYFLTQSAQREGKYSFSDHETYFGTWDLGRVSICESEISHSPDARLWLLRAPWNSIRRRVLVKSKKRERCTRIRRWTALQRSVQQRLPS